MKLLANGVVWISNFRDVPLPCSAEAPLKTFDDLKSQEQSRVARLDKCYVYDCQAQTEQW